MQYSTNNKLKLMEGTDNVKRQDFVDNFNIIDNGLSKFYVATLNSANVYKVVTGNSLTSLNNGYSIRVAIPSNSTGAVSIIVDSVTVPVKKPNGNAVTNFKANGVYTLSYYNSVFTLASGGTDDVSFSAGDLLTGKNANNSDGEKVNGTMANNGAVTSTLTAGTSYTIPAGYHNGAGKITANNLASQTSATATANQILSGQTAYVNGNKITGNMPNNGSSVQTVRSLVYDNKLIFRINEGYYGGSIYSDGKGQASVCEPLNYVADVLGITGDKILAGNNICGVSGTATIYSMGGVKKTVASSQTEPFKQNGGNAYWYGYTYINIPSNPSIIIVKATSGSQTFFTALFIDEGNIKLTKGDGYKLGASIESYAGGQLKVECHTQVSGSAGKVANVEAIIYS